MKDKQVIVGRPGTPGGASGERADRCVTRLSVVTNVGLISQRRRRGLDFHRVAPPLSKRIRRERLIGKAREDTRVLGRLFTSCVVECSLLEEVNKVAEDAVPGDVLLLSPACSSFDQFRTIGIGAMCFAKRILREGTSTTFPCASSQTKPTMLKHDFLLCFGFFEEKPRRNSTTNKQPPQRKDANQRQRQ